MNVLALAVFCITPMGQTNAAADAASAMHTTLPSPTLRPLYETESPALSLAMLDDVQGEAMAPPFGKAQSWRWHVGAGAAVDVKRSRNRLVQAGLGVSYFLVDDLSFDAEFNVIYFNQIGDDAVGANLNLTFRYHFINNDSWSLYGDAGAGMLLSTAKVPTNGSSFNFVPHAGVGMSFDLGSSRRLMTGIRWHHISNASLYSDNPGRDSALAYVSLSFPY